MTLVRRHELRLRVVRSERLIGRRGRMQVPEHEAAARRQPVSGGLIRQCAFAGVQAQQVMKRIASWTGFFEQARSGELLERPPCLDHTVGGERRRGGHHDVTPRVQAEQPEHARGSGRQRLIGPGDHRADGHQIVVVGTRELVQTLGGRRELGGHRGQRETRLGLRPVRDDPQGQRQETAGARDRVR